MNGKSDIDAGKHAGGTRPRRSPLTASSASLFLLASLSAASAAAQDEPGAAKRLTPSSQRAGSSQPAAASRPADSQPSTAARQSDPVAIARRECRPGARCKHLQTLLSLAQEPERGPEALELLGRLGDPRAASMLAHLAVYGAYDNVRQAAARALAQLAARGPGTGAVARIAERSADAAIRRVATEALPEGVQPGSGESEETSDTNAQRTAVQPIVRYWLPPEIAPLQTHLGLALTYTNVGRFWGVLGPAPGDLHIVMLTINGQYVFGDRFELGLTVPLVIHGWIAGAQIRRDSTAFGNASLDLKLRLGGSSSRYALSLFANTLLPTTSADIDHGFFAVYPGIAGSYVSGWLTLGGSIGPHLFVTPAGPQSTTGLFRADVFAAARFLHYFGLQTALQFAVPVVPSTETPGVGMLLAAQLFLLGGLHVDLGMRVGLNDPEGRFFTPLGRVSLVLGAGWSFDR